MKRFTKILSLILCCALLAGLFTTSVAAKKTVKLVTIGDSTSMGYLLNDFNWTHKRNGEAASQYANCALTAQYLRNTWKLDVDAVDLSLTGSRPTELRAILDPSYYARDNVHGAGLSYCGDHFNGQWGYINQWNSYQGYDDIHDVFTKEIKEADILIYDLSMADSTSLIGSLSNPAYYYGYKTCYELIEAEGCPLAAQGIETLRASLDAMLNGLGIPAEQINGLIGGLLCAYASFCCNFSKSVELIYDLNPTVNLIVVGPFNAMRGVTVTTGDIEIDFGRVAQLLNDALFNYSVILDKNCWRYRYADCRGGVDTLQDAAAAGDWTNYTYFYNEICKAYGLSSTEDTENIQRNISAACANRTFPLEMLLDASQCFEPGRAALTDPDASQEAKSALAMTIMQGMSHAAGVHPDLNGYQQKFAAIRQALLSCTAANGTYLTRLLDDTVGFVNNVVASVFGNKESINKIKTAVKTVLTPVIRISLFK